MRPALRSARLEPVTAIHTADTTMMPPSTTEPAHRPTATFATSTSTSHGRRAPSSRSATRRNRQRGDAATDQSVGLGGAGPAAESSRSTCSQVSTSPEAVVTGARRSSSIPRARSSSMCLLAKRMNSTAMIVQR